jgi:hypothetical protein
VESFNGKLRDELLNRELFLNLPQARYVLDEWREECDERRPHSGLNWQTPGAYAASLTGPSVGAQSPSPRLSQRIRTATDPLITTGTVTGGGSGILLADVIWPMMPL